MRESQKHRKSPSHAIQKPPKRIAKKEKISKLRNKSDDAQ